MLDKSIKRTYTKKELAAMDAIIDQPIPHLNNRHKRLVRLRKYVRKA